MSKLNNLRLESLEKFLSARVKTPIIKLNDFFNELKDHGDVFLIADFLNHPLASGNKFWKLKYVLKHLIKNKHKGLISFGGPFSNHLYACAMACQALEIPFIAIVRGENHKWQSYTLREIEKTGAQIIPVPIGQYRSFTLEQNIEVISSKWPEHFILPEGGNHPLLGPGLADFVEEIQSQSEFYLPTTWLLAAGTGGTAAGLQNALDHRYSIHAINVLKNDNLSTTLPAWGNSEKQLNKALLTIHNDYHFGGYAKTTIGLLDFIRDFYNKSGIPLDPVYTSKLLFAFFDLWRKNIISKNTATLIWHTGGLQGSIGFNEVRNEKLPVEYQEPRI